MCGVIHPDCCVLYLHIHVVSVSQPAVAAADGIDHEIKIRLARACIRC